MRDISSIKPGDSWIEHRNGFDIKISVLSNPQDYSWLRCEISLNGKRIYLESDDRFPFDGFPRYVGTLMRAYQFTDDERYRHKCLRNKKK